MFCSNCGQELNDGVKLCAKCGVKLESDTISQSQYQTASNTLSLWQYFIGGV
jgi:uncharacterized membrane protein YvbJ